VVALEARQWRGNVRELRNVVYRLALMARDEEIDAASVNEIVGEEATPPSAPLRVNETSLTGALENWLASEAPPDGLLHARAIAAFEKPLIEHALRRTQGNQLRAAKLLGINRNTLRKRIGELEISPDRFGRSA
jgi:two-component system nitrogen regulation response regulator GlnG